MKLSKGLKWFSALLVTTSVLSTTVPVTAAPFSLFGSKEQLSDEDIQKIQEVYRSIREGYIEEIDKENRENFLNNGGQSYQYIPALNVEHTHIEMMGKLILEKLA